MSSRRPPPAKRTATTRTPSFSSSSQSSASDSPSESSSRSDHHTPSSSRSTAPRTHGFAKPAAVVLPKEDEDLQRLGLRRQKPSLHHDEDIAPSVKFEATSSASVNTYDSTLSGLEEGDELFEDDGTELERPHLSSSSDDAIPTMLPPYRTAAFVEPSLRPSTPHSFGRLFPSVDRLSIRHDDFTPDGNMNLRVDTVVPGGRRPIAIQLFHLRMHDLALRDFSLRRYCRESGREVCNSKRTYTETSPVASAIRSVGRPLLHRSSSTATSLLGRRRPCSSSSSAATSASSHDGDETTTVSPPNARRPSVSTVSSGSVIKFPAAAPCLVPTNAIKLEFSNYARVDVVRHGSRGYEFEWWGHRYCWRRDVDKALGVFSFHLVRDGHGAPVAHIVPEVRTASQVETDNEIGGWVPPSFMWISDHTIVDAATDIADVIVATGLIALVDNSIKERWPAKKPAARRLSFHTNSDAETSRPRAFLRNILNRRHSDQYTSSPLRIGRALAAH
ncbi:hypothetical protein S40285_05334 [Stachybotrys chlorohalonatus IBT 40285]|uniref:Uncharacterized protein n=1 Tax=Stachybotrys chlorohalonatus (strain IBT 40285) TaxID=1283841 RepID=A0A084QNV1_STAC4|nr:hypothetical protein S40285_05334 [Stachybotrys chlorohalonata IBT 40285]